MNKMLELLRRRHRPDNESLSALLDGQLAGRQLDAVQAHAASCAACRDRLAALRRTRDALRALPEVDAPRSFRLRAADVAAPAPVRRMPVAIRAMPVLGAAAALVFIVVIEADLARGGSSTSNQATGLQAFSAATRGAATAPGTVGQIGGADSPAGPTTASNDALSSSSGNPTVAPPATASDSSSGGAGAPTTAGSPPPPVTAQAPGGPEAAGSPQPALGLAPEQATPGGEQAAPNAPAPAIPSTQAEQPSLPKSAATQPAATPAEARQAAAAATSSNSKSASSQSSDRESSGRSDVTYRIVEALAGAIALAAAASFVVWRIRNRKVVP